MFIRVTNARTGKMVTINPNSIANVQDRDDDRYPTTKAVILLNDKTETFIPCKETEDEIHRLISGSSGGVATRRMPVVDDQDPGAQPR